MTDLDKKYDLHEIVRDEAIFAATGVTRSTCGAGRSSRSDW